MTQTHPLENPQASAGPTPAAATAPASATAPALPASLAGYRRAFDTVFAVLAVVFLAAVIVQFLLAGLGTFHHRGAPGPGFGPHEALGNALGITASVLFIVALVAHVSWRTVVCALVMALLTETAQHALAQFGWNNQWLGALHAMDGSIIILLAAGLAVTAVRRQRRRP